ncbi:unnamed protein product [Mytilus coruscus]|uniref:Ig-like domain-containing protein n=1 Tax=Mytilus coruscus TaxID=42192 RepID=A0A6J8DYC9_MYTCO|nr:unnamed protein product [Mytilus coruscus]
MLNVMMCHRGTILILLISETILRSEGDSSDIIYIKSNSSVLFTCPFSSDTGAVIWRGPPDLMLYGINEKMNDKLPKNERITIIKDETTRQYNLYFEMFFESDQGLFKCDTIQNGKTTEHAFKTTLAEIPSSIIIGSDNSFERIIGVEGMAMEVNCSVIGGLPEPTLSLLHRDKVVNVTNTTIVQYTFIPSKENHMDNFTCIADNGFFRLQTTLLFLVKVCIHNNNAALFLYYDICYLPSQKVSAEEGNYITPTVHVFAEPSPNITENNSVTLLCSNDTITYPTDLVWKFNQKVIAGESHDHLFLLKVQRQQAGLYTCKVTNSAGTGVNGLYLIVKYMPTVADNFTYYKYDAELGQSTKISLIVDSFQKPEIAWTMSAGGKLGYWTVATKNDHLYSISTTILPEEESHLGKYEMRIRNEVGSIDVVIKLVSRVVTMVPYEAVCNTSESVELSCVYKDIHLQTGWTVSWIHKLKSIFIRSPSATINGNVSTMIINFCDYKDTGTYSCKWTSGEKMYKSTAKLTVHGLPVFSYTDIVVLNKSSVKLNVYFYSKPEPIQIKWLFNSKTIQHPSTLPLNRQYVNLTIYNKVISVEGFKATMLLITAPNPSDCIYTCSVRNRFGIIEPNFQEKEVLDAIRIWENETKGGNDNEGMFPPSIASVDTTGQRYCIVLLNVYNKEIISLQISVSYVINYQEIVTTGVTQQQQQDEENSLQHNSIYEEIQSIQSQIYRDDTDNENGHVDTSGSDTSSERPYLELEPPNTEMDKKVVLAKKKDHGGLTLQSSKAGVVIGHTKEGGSQGIVNEGVSKIAEYLESLGR